MTKGHDKGHKGQMSDREVMKLALEALESAADNECNFHDYKHAAAALRQALEQPEQSTKCVEPFAWVRQDVCAGQFIPSTMQPRKIWWECEKNIGFPIYTAPPSKPWVALTDEELRELEKLFNAQRVRTPDEEYLMVYPSDYWEWQRAIEAKLKEKNK